ncbi:hypothetical protein ZYGR_0V00140 [Zygosaccharomyces rouxii]|uniref:GYF domain-containing protein n=1 Tax=Zygosaccharomyces rouxii TaxID=4956 RepID=A0A1Q2ZYI2_ZYGRO|nr:hypothetical protein ZYGR_0J00140 [Zygosaccharomyces rouxii]GAV50481.1 hypothetical protein ZYGR_0V00140 [Zygosaccharomyces rouxii]
MARDPSNFATGKHRRDSLEDEEDSNPDEQGFLKKGRYASRQRKRNLNTSAYDSDSFDDNSESESESGKTEKKENHNEDDDDMFASGDDQKPEKRSGQGTESFKDAFDYDDPKFEQQESLLDKQDVQLESFNMDEDATQNESRNNMNDGYIQNGEDNREDQWIDEVEDVKGVAESQRRDKERRQQKLNEVQKRQRHYMVDEALIRLQYFINPGETVLAALGRLNKLRNRDESSGYVINAINFLTDLIDIIERKGIEDVYSLRRSDLFKLIEEESLGDSFSIDNYKTKMWSFKWIKKPDIIYGEYSNYQMQYWKKSYFQHNVAVKICFEPNEPVNWVHIDCVNFM